jgi:hypothetical protein
MTEQAASVVAEKLVASCMKRRGFDYVPTLFAGSVLAAALGSDGRTDPVKFRKLFGFGITTRTNAQMTVDPNSEILRKLEPAQRSAYRAALLGTDLPLIAPGSCRGMAERRVYGDRQKIRVLESKLRKLESRIDLLPDVREAIRRFEACIKNRVGIEVSGPSGPGEYVLVRLEEEGNSSGLQRLEYEMAEAQDACEDRLAPRIDQYRRIDEAFITSNALAIRDLKEDEGPVTSSK